MSPAADTNLEMAATTTPGVDGGGLERGLITVIRAYQGLRSGRPTGCRYLPTCSEYAVQAIESHGAGHGSMLAARRIMHCHPWGGHGIDPVPGREA
jgi:uncharacterized protein